jgi:hypothetical protein
MSILAFAVLNAVLAALLVAGLVAVMRQPLLAGAGVPAEQPDLTAPGESLPLAA